VKSTLYFGPPCTTSQITVAITKALENMYAMRRYFMNGMLVPISSWNMRAASRSSDAQPLDLAAAQPVVVDHPREQHRGVQIGDQADAQRDREPLDGAGAELEQEHRADERGDVGVENGAERAVVAHLDRLPHAALVAQLLTDALEDQHVGVDRHA